MRHHNQHTCNHNKPVGKYLLAFYILMLILGGAYLTQTNKDIISPYVAQAQFVGKAKLVSASGSALLVKAQAQTAGQITQKEPDACPVMEGYQGLGPCQDDIEAYVKTIFGKDAKTAIAVSHVECNPQNKAYPACVYHTEHEYSVGIFQINLFNAKHSIHAAKVPGKTMEEKIEALKDPYINTLVAYKIFTASSWNPWAGFTSGRYLAHL